MNEFELSRPVKIKAVTEESYVIEANETERTALAKRFELSELSKLYAEVQLTPERDAITAKGTLSARWTQPCAVAGDDFPVKLDEEISMRFVSVRNLDQASEEEIEVSDDELDEIFYEGDSFDLGEGVAQTLSLAIDPYATGPNAGRVRKEKGIVEEGTQAGPLAEALAALKKG